MNFEKVKKVKNSKPFTVLDCIIVAALTAILVGLIVWLFFRETPSKVVITSPDFYEELELSEDATVSLEHITVHVDGGRVWVTDADCPDKTCEHTGIITRAGQSIVCLPNGVVVSISGKSDLQWEIGR